MNRPIKSPRFFFGFHFSIGWNYFYFSIGRPWLMAHKAWIIEWEFHFQGRAIHKLGKKLNEVGTEIETSSS